MQTNLDHPIPAQGNHNQELLQGNMSRISEV